MEESIKTSGMFHTAEKGELEQFICIGCNGKCNIFKSMSDSKACCSSLGVE